MLSVSCRRKRIADFRLQSPFTYLLRRLGEQRVDYSSRQKYSTAKTGENGVRSKPMKFHGISPICFFEKAAGDPQ
jgi:hypothetical protein